MTFKLAFILMAFVVLVLLIVCELNLEKFGPTPKNGASNTCAVNLEEPDPTPENGAYSSLIPVDQDIEIKMFRTPPFIDAQKMIGYVITDNKTGTRMILVWTCEGIAITKCDR